MAKEFNKAMKIRTIVITGVMLLMLLMPTLAGIGYNSLFTLVPSIFAGLLGDSVAVYYIAVIALWCAVALAAGVLGLTIASFFTDKVNKALRIVSIITSVFAMIAFVIALIPTVYYLMFAISEGAFGEILGLLWNVIVFAVCAMWLFVLNIKTAKRLK